MEAGKTSDPIAVAMSKQMKEMSVLAKQGQCLNAIEIFCDLSTEEIAAITKKAPVRYVEPKTIIYFPEQPGEVLFMLSEGQIQLYQLAPDGRIITNAILMQAHCSEKWHC